MGKLRIGQFGKVNNTNICGKVSHIRHGDSQDPTKYKIQGRYWNASGVRKSSRRTCK